MATNPKADYRRDIDGLRALAVLPVVLYHAGFSLFSGGFVGVDIFFVISGFLITGIISSDIRQDQYSVLRFYERRIRRIFPALFTVFIFTSICAFILLLPQDLKTYSQSLASATLFISNIFFWAQSGYFDTAAELKPLLHTWSLAVEEQYYILFPLFLMLAWRWGGYWRALTWAGLVASLFLSIYGVRYHPGSTFYLLPTRAWELLIGSVIALGAVPHIHHQLFREVLSALGIALITYAIFFFDRNTLFPGESALLPCLGAAFIIYAGREGKKSWTARALSWRPVVFIGLISYSLYLWHWPLIVFSKYYTIVPLSHIESVGIILLSICVAWLSWRYVEAPFRKGNNTPFTSTRTRIFTTAGLAMSSAVLIGLVSTTAPSWLQGEDATVSIIAQDAEIGQTLVRPCVNSYDNSQYKKSMDSCVFGPDLKFADAILWGDSHAGAILPALIKAIPAGRHGIRTLIMPGCPPVKDVHLRISRAKNCNHYNDDTIRYIQTGPERAIVLAARWAYAIRGENDLPETETAPSISIAPGVTLSTDEARHFFKQKIELTLSTLLATGKEIYLVYPTPEGYYDYKSVLARQYMHHGKAAMSKLNIPKADNVARTRDVIAIFDALADAPNFHRIKPADMHCNQTRCLVTKDGKSLYFDDDHLSNAGAEYIAPLFASIFAASQRTLD